MTRLGFCLSFNKQGIPSLLLGSVLISMREVSMIPKRVDERLIKTVPRFQQVLKTAKDRDVNETDTLSIIKDIFAEIFGYDKYMDLTSEYSVRGTFCDLAIKFDNKIEFLIEAKAIGIDLKDSHLRQALDYCANSGVQWAILTNGASWYIYKIKFEQPISADLICSFNLIDLDIKNEEIREKLYIVCKEGLAKDAREEFHEKFLTINRFLLGALICSDEIIFHIRRELRKVSGGVLASSEEILKVLSGEVLKRDVLEGDEAIKAQSRIKKYYSKIAKRTKETDDLNKIEKETEESDTPTPQDIQETTK